MCVLLNKNFWKFASEFYSIWKHQIRWETWNRLFDSVGKKLKRFFMFSTTFLIITKIWSTESSIESIRSILPKHTNISYFLDFQINMFSWRVINLKLKVTKTTVIQLSQNKFYIIFFTINRQVFSFSINLYTWPRTIL